MSIPATVYINFNDKHYVQTMEEETINSYARKAIAIYPELKNVNRASIIISFNDIFCIFIKKENEWFVADAYPIRPATF